MKTLAESVDLLTLKKHVDDISAYWAWKKLPRDHQLDIVLAQTPMADEEDVENARMSWKILEQDYLARCNTYKQVPADTTRPF